MLDISNDTWGLIVFGLLGSLLGFFFLRMIRQLDKNTSATEELSKHIIGLNYRLKKLEEK